MPEYLHQWTVQATDSRRNACKVTVGVTTKAWIVLVVDRARLVVLKPDAAMHVSAACVQVWTEVEQIEAAAWGEVL
jgi:hypothetical protein